MPRSDHLLRLLETYLLRRPSHLDFWHDRPEENPRATYDKLGEYYLIYREKTAYRGPFDARGVPLLNYRGRIGPQHNPIAIAQYGLAQYNRLHQSAGSNAREKFLLSADWLVEHLERNSSGVEVWQHHFEWPYREPLKPPWASALAQGQGISLLVRAAQETGRSFYLETAGRALRALHLPLEEGGLVHRINGDLWLEEYLVHPPSHILNGALCAAWGLLDYHLHAGDKSARDLFLQAAETLGRHLMEYDAGFWSLYELPAGGPPMLASPYYHRLHIVQLKIMGRMTGRPLFSQVAQRWDSFQNSPACRTRALLGKALFKLRRY